MHSDGGTDLSKVDDLRSLSGDALLHIPASSVEVEKLHAKTLAILTPGRTAGRKPDCVQEDTYVMSVYLEHSAIKRDLEKETFGSGSARAGALLKNRVFARTTPGRSSATCGVKKDANVTKRTSVVILGWS